MNTVSVWSAMTPLEELATVRADSTLLDTASALRACNVGVPGPALVRVADDSGRTLGVVGMVDVIKGFDPRYQEGGFFENTQEKGFSKGLLEAIFIADYGYEHISIT